MSNTHTSCCGAGDHEEGDCVLAAVDLPRVTCLNERIDGSCRKIFKAFSERRNKDTFMQSQDYDNELILHVPFVSSVRLKSFCLSGGENGKCPSKVRIFTNRPDLDFDSVYDATPTQEIDIGSPDHEADLWYPLQVSKFNNVYSVAIHFSGNLEPSADDVEIYFVGLRGDNMGWKRGIVDAVYELRPLSQDNPVSDHLANARHLGM